MQHTDQPVAERSKGYQDYLREQQKKQHRKASNYLHQRRRQRGSVDGRLLIALLGMILVVDIGLQLVRWISTGG